MFIQAEWSRFILGTYVYFSFNVRKRTFSHVRPAKIQISLRIRAGWSESSLGAFWIAKEAKLLHEDNEDSDHITKTCLYNFDPLKPHFFIVKLGFTGVCIIFLISAQNIDCGYSLEPPRRGGSNEYPQSMFWAEICKIYQNFLSENFHFFVVKFLNRCVFVMRLRGCAGWLKSLGARVRRYVFSRCGPVNPAWL